ncbi:MAG: hypothetical protein RRZ24_00665 [Clostridia bacterium]
MAQASRHVYAGNPFSDQGNRRVRLFCCNGQMRILFTHHLPILLGVFVLVYLLMPAHANAQVFYPAKTVHSIDTQPSKGGESDACLLASENEPVSSEYNAISKQKSIFIHNWQGAKNYLDSFHITVSSGSPASQIQFASSNCTVTPSSGTTDTSYKVTITGAGAYSVTAIMAGNGADGVQSETRKGMAGKADQSPLFITGWGGARDYYHTFNIVVGGGTVGGAISFSCDGCSVSPATGLAGDVFAVTVTRVGPYELTAIMSGNQNYRDGYSTRQCGTSNKSSQAPLEITGWESAKRYGDSFTVHIAGGSSGEALTINASGCIINKITGSEYEVKINSVGPYSVTANRPGNYGYSNISASTCGIAKLAYQSALSVTGWASAKNVSDSFPIHVTGGMTDGEIRFATVGCSVSPQTGKVSTTFVVTVNSVGPYSMTAFIDGTDCFAGVTSSKLTGTSNKAPQRKLSIDNWNVNAPVDSSFDIRLTGGNGTGATSLTTLSGCHAVLKSGETDIYTVTITATSGSQYCLSVSKAGDANFNSGTPQTVHGTASKSSQPILSVDGWNDASCNGETFIIHLSGGGQDEPLDFETAGCEILPAKNRGESAYEVTVTAATGEAYSLKVNRTGSGIYPNTFTLKSGNVRPASARIPQADNKAMALNSYESLLWLGILLSVLAMFMGLLLLRQRRPKRRPHRRH